MKTADLQKLQFGLQTFLLQHDGRIPGYSCIAQGFFIQFTSKESKFMVSVSGLGNP